MSNPSGDSTVTGLPAAATLQGTEVVPMDQVQGGSLITVRASVNQIISQGLAALLSGTVGQVLTLVAGPAAQWTNSPIIIAGTINNTPIGATTRNTGAFTTLAANGTFTASGGVAITGGGTAVIDTITLTNALTVANGGTGRATLTSRAVLIGEGTSAVNFAAPGTAGQALISAGAAADPVFGFPTGALIGVQRFTASGTYTPTTGTNSIIIMGTGGGGGGGGNAATTGAQVALGGQGSAGSWGVARITSVTTQTVTIGAAGTAGAAGANAGGNGGQTSIGTYLVCPGGNGGAAGTATAFANVTVFGVSAGPASAPTSSGTLLYGGSGQSGFPAHWAYNGGNAVVGSGGGNPFGSGGFNTVLQAAGATGSGFGSGGSGGTTGSSSGAFAGGAGTAGLIIVYEYS